jgi:hypothetical protein
MRKFLIEVVGWYGVAAVLTAYILTTLAIIDSESLWFIFLNLSGALSLMVVSYYKKTMQTLVLNLVWAIVAIIGLIISLIS